MCGIGEYIFFLFQFILKTTHIQHETLFRGRNRCRIRTCFLTFEPWVVNADSFLFIDYANFQFSKIPAHQRKDFFFFSNWKKPLMLTHNETILLNADLLLLAPQHSRAEQSKREEKTRRNILLSAASLFRVTYWGEFNLKKKRSEERKKWCVCFFSIMKQVGNPKPKT